MGNNFLSLSAVFLIMPHGLLKAQSLTVPTNGLVAWYSGDYQATSYANGAGLTNLLDSSGNGYTSTGTNPPTLVYNVAGPHAAMRFEDTGTAVPLNQWVALNTNITLNATNCSIFAVSRLFCPNSGSLVTIGSGGWYSNIAYRAMFAANNLWALHIDGRTTATTSTPMDAGLVLHGFTCLTNPASSQAISVNFYMDGRFLMESTIYGVVNLQYSGGFLVGDGTTSYSSACDLFEILFYNHALSTQEIAQLWNWAASSYAISTDPCVQVTCIGDSITGGGGSGENGEYNNQPYPEQLEADLGERFSVLNFGWGGARSQNVNSDVSNYCAVPMSSKSWARQIVVMQPDANDWISGVDGTTCYSNYVACTLNATRWGATALGATVMRSTPTNAAAFNALIHSSYVIDTGAAGIVDFQADPRLANSNNTNYFHLDEVHPTDAGCAVMAELVAAAINPLIQWPVISDPVCNAEGSVTLNLVTSTNGTSRILAATNLTPPVAWQAIYTNATGGNWQFTDSNAVVNPMQFYRVTSP